MLASLYYQFDNINLSFVKMVSLVKLLLTVLSISSAKKRKLRKPFAPIQLVCNQLKSREDCKRVKDALGDLQVQDEDISYFIHIPDVSKFHFGALFNFWQVFSITKIDYVPIGSD